MLDGLDRVEWASLTHAYGSAEDVPGLLRDLRSDDPEARREAHYELCGNIYHQGTRYEASAFAVPFLLELLADPATPDRVSIVQLLGALAIGSSYHYVVTGFPIAELREQVAQLPESTRQTWMRQRKEWMAAFRSSGPGQPMPLSPQERRLLEVCHELATYDAVGEGIDLLTELAEDSDAELAGQAVHVLAWFPESADVILPVLTDLVADDQAPVELVSAALVALGHVAPKGTHDHDPLLESHLGGEEESLRWAAAVASAYIAGEEMPQAAQAELRTWAAGDDDHSPYPIWEIGRSELALKLLDRWAPAVAQRIRLDLTVAELAKEPKSSWHNHFNEVLDRAFPWADFERGLGFAELAPAQQAVVTWLIEHPEVFGSSGPDGPLRQYGLPATHAALLSYAGVEL